MCSDAPKTIPKMNDMKGQFHATIHPGTMAPVAMGSPYELKGGKGTVAKMTSRFGQGQPMLEASKDPQKIRTTGGGPYGM